MVDLHLSILFKYIEDNYKNNEIVVSLFGDHGQGYLVKKDQFFLSPERTNVAFMFRGDNIQAQDSYELVSTADYVTSMCKLCGISMNNEKIDGVLTKTFGNASEREYVITESIFHSNPYYASVYWKNYIFNFTSNESVGEDGRFHWDAGYTTALIDYDGNKIRNEEYEKKKIEIIRKHIETILIYD